MGPKMRVERNLKKKKKKKKEKRKKGQGQGRAGQTGGGQQSFGDSDPFGSGTKYRCKIIVL